MKQNISMKQKYKGFSEKLTPKNTKTLTEIEIWFNLAYYKNSKTNI